MNKLKLLYKVWKGRRAQKRYNISNWQLAEVFVKAKQNYEYQVSNESHAGMCWIVTNTLFTDFRKLPKDKFLKCASLFCSEFLINRRLSSNELWWPRSEEKERLVAFDKLITLYSADKIIVTIFNVEIKL